MFQAWTQLWQEQEGATSWSLVKPWTNWEPFPSQTPEDQSKSHGWCFLSVMSRFFEYIYLYESMVLFQIDQKTKDCSKIPLLEDWDPFDIPANSTFEDQYIIGGPGDNVEVQEWSDRKPARKRKSTCVYAFIHLVQKNEKSTQTSTRHSAG